MSQPFLRSIAQAYTSKFNDLAEYKFVFPNRRSGTFFLKEVSDCYKDTCRVLPEVATMSDFTEQLCGYVVAGKIEQLFILYHVYCRLLAADGVKELPSFDRFRRWGETALSDLNEVDMQSADADALFKNVKDVKEISANFLTDEQLAVMEEYFGYDKNSGERVRTFWKTFIEYETGAHEKNELHSKFRLIWQMMSPLYHAFRKELESRGLISNGGSYRRCADLLEENASALLTSKKIVFVGFNALTASERRIFNALAKYEMDDGSSAYSDFIWDITGPVICDNASSAGRYVRHNAKRWPMPEWLLPFIALSEEKEITPVIRTIGIPSNSMQAKVASEEVAAMARRIPEEDFNSAKVAVVLPDENLLLPMLYSLPEEIRNVNLTMGYPIKLTAIATYVSLLRRLQGSRRRSRGKIGYYFKDLELVLSHPFSQILFGAETERTKYWIKDHHRTIVDIDEFRDECPVIGELLIPFPDSASGSDAAVWLDAILETLLCNLSENDHVTIKNNLDKATVEFYRLSLRRMVDIAREYDVAMEWRTFLTMTDRLISGETVTFEGQPLVGLQVMGLLETRALDFERIIIPSLNERIMPARRRPRTFLSDSLRQAFGLPPVNYAESIFSYYFYRMIARAKEVVLLYDSRSSEGARNGDVSRYVLQLKYLYARDKMTIDNRSFLISKSDLRPYPIVKKGDPYVEAILKRYCNQEEDSENLSSTALTNYASCQVKFYFHEVLKLRDDVESTDFIDAITEGNIVHYVMEHLYLPADKRKRLLKHPELIDEEFLKQRIEDQDRIDRLIRKAINKMHFHLPQSRQDDPLHGSAKSIAKLLRKQITNILEFDLIQAPFKLYGVEISGNVAVIFDGRKINMRFAIDRLDSVSIHEDGEYKECLRIVDYKTGSTYRVAESLKSVFEGDYRCKHLLQLWLYANIFNAVSAESDDFGIGRQEIRLTSEGSGATPLILELYNVNKIKSGQHTYPMVENVEHKTHLALNEEFLKELRQMIGSLFENPTFEPTCNASTCNLCSFKNICWR